MDKFRSGIHRTPACTGTRLRGSKDASIMGAGVSQDVKDPVNGGSPASAFLQQNVDDCNPRMKNSVAWNHWPRYVSSHGPKLPRSLTYDIDSERCEKAALVVHLTVGDQRERGAKRGCGKFWSAART